MDEFEDLLGEGTEEETGIQVTDKYKIDTYDYMNVVVKEKYLPKATEDNPNPQTQWKVISYHPSIEYAFKSICDKEINSTVKNGIEAVIQKIRELKKFKPNNK